MFNTKIPECLVSILGTALTATRQLLHKPLFGHLFGKQWEIAKILETEQSIALLST
jgi:hypothetical protein